MASVAGRGRVHTQHDAAMRLQHDRAAHGPTLPVDEPGRQIDPPPASSVLVQVHGGEAVREPPLPDVPIPLRLLEGGTQVHVELGDVLELE